MKTKIATSITQSKKLIELGIDINTADMWWAERYEGRVTENGEYIVAKEPYYYLSFIKPSDINYSQDSIRDIPAWSLSALIELMPYPILNNTLKSKWRCTIYRKNGLILKTGEDVDSPLDAAFAMVCYSLENKLI